MEVHEMTNKIFDSPCQSKIWKVHLWYSYCIPYVCIAVSNNFPDCSWFCGNLTALQFFNFIALLVVLMWKGFRWNKHIMCTINLFLYNIFRPQLPVMWQILPVTWHTMWSDTDHVTYYCHQTWWKHALMLWNLWKSVIRNCQNLLRNFPNHWISNLKISSIYFLLSLMIICFGMPFQGTGKCDMLYLDASQLHNEISRISKA